METIVDHYLLQAQRATEQEDFTAAQVPLDEISSIGMNYGLVLPEQFSLRRAKVGRQAGRHKCAVQYASQYLSITGRDGEF